ncbi:MAG: ribonuclease III [Thiogranum sp.]|nr:ribonuclease III [Thiogranum sp.]
MSDALDALGRALQYRFRNPALLEAALTHRSAASLNNERMEFLGDAVLGYLIAAGLFERFPEATEGQLSRLRAMLVKRDTLASVARNLKLGDYLRLGSGELKSGGFRRDSILADALEAILGAIVLDNGGSLDACDACVQRLFAERIEKLSPVDELKDPKTRLQEYLQSRRLELPVYKVLEISGDAHDQSFVVECRVAGVEAPVRGAGSSRRRAEQVAAEAALVQLHASSPDGA